MSLVVQSSPSSQEPPSLAGAPPVQLPLEQVSPTVQVLPSLHAAPLLPGTATHVSLTSLQLPIRQMSALGGAQVLGTPLQTPAVHLSWMVQKRPSVQGPFSLVG